MVGGGLGKVLIGTTRMDYIHIWKGQGTYLIKIRIREKVIMYKVISIYWNTMNNKLKFRFLDTEGCCGSCSTWHPRVTEEGVSVKDRVIRQSCGHTSMGNSLGYHDGWGRSRLNADTVPLRGAQRKLAEHYACMPHLSALDCGHDVTFCGSCLISWYDGLYPRIVNLEKSPFPLSCDLLGCF